MMRLTDAEVLKLLRIGLRKAYALAGGLDAARAAGIEVVSERQIDSKLQSIQEET